MAVSLGLPKTSNRVGITLHILRHMTATILAALMKFLATVLGGL